MDVDLDCGAVKVRRAVTRVAGEIIVGTPKSGKGTRDEAKQCDADSQTRLLIALILTPIGVLGGTITLTAGPSAAAWRPEDDELALLRRLWDFVWNHQEALDGGDHVEMSWEDNQRRDRLAGGRRGPPRQARLSAGAVGGGRLNRR